MYPLLDNYTTELTTYFSLVVYWLCNLNRRRLQTFVGDKIFGVLDVITCEDWDTNQENKSYMLK